MKTDIEIAQEAKMLPIQDVAAKLGIEAEDLEMYGKYKTKLSKELWDKVKNNPDGKLVLVTAINPTPAGEGKTTVQCRSRTGTLPYRKKSIDCTQRAIFRALLWHQRRRCRRRLCTGCAYGRLKPPFYGRFSCNHFGQ